MTKIPKNQGKSWEGQESQLKSLAKGNTPTGLVAYTLGRSENSVRSKASELGISLHPVNRSPYGPRKK